MPRFPLRGVFHILLVGRFRTARSSIMTDLSLRVFDSVLDMLSNENNPTPIVRLNRVVPFRDTKVYATLEWYNPFGAVKDRIAANLVRDAEERGILSHGKGLVEATSGNTGLGLAMIGN